MPEGPETRTIARVANSFFLGADSDSFPVEINFGDFSYNGSMIGGFYTVGKVVVAELADGQLLIGMGMTGTLVPGLAGGTHVRAVIKVGNVPIGFKDPRKFGTLAVARHPAAHWASCPECCLELAPSWIDKSGIPQREAITQSAIAYKSNRSVHAVLLDQRAVMSGVGNIYASEACFAAGVDPRASWNSVDQKRRALLVKEAANIMMASLRMGGSSIRTYVAGDKPGEYQKLLMVYGRDGKEVIDATGKKRLVNKVKLGGRSAYFVE